MVDPSSKPLAEADLDYLFDILSVSVYACNRKLREVLLTLDGPGRTDYARSAVLYEFFFHQPVERSSDAAARDSSLQLVPFLARLFTAWPTMPDPQATGEMISTSESQLAALRPVLHLRDTQFAASLIQCWASSSALNQTGFSCKLSENGEAYGEISLSGSQISEDLEAALKKQKDHISAGDWVSLRSRDSKIILYSALRALLPSGQAKREHLYLLLPIADSDLLFGQLWVGLPNIDLGSSHSAARLQRHVLRLCAELRRYYVPALSVVHEHFWEWLVKRHMGHKESLTETLPETLPHYRNPFANSPSSQGEPLLKAFHRLAVARAEVEEQASKPEPRFSMPDQEGGDATAVKESLIFERYVIASPLMIELLRRVVATAERLLRQGNSLPSVLVVGGAGSGKDTIASLLRLFSRRYRNGRTYIINMSGLKPDPVATAALVGSSEGLTGHGEAPAGLLRHLRQESLQFVVDCLSANAPGTASLPELLKTRCENDPLAGSRFATLTLDELNSLPADSQGVLLRFLENSEITRVGSAKDEKISIESHHHIFSATSGPEIASVTDFLVVGIMNENPDDLTMEDAIATLRSERYVGGAMGDWLYDVFARSRRLRADLKYRLVRDGKFVIPDLKERREDIPILFYVTVRRAFESLGQRDGFKISPYVYEDLLTAQTTWPGNVRQLQAVARRCVELVADQQASCCITAFHLQQALEEMVFRKPPKRPDWLENLS
jgi:transcriptional regulator with AAA-type ATPase domain